MRIDRVDGSGEAAIIYRPDLQQLLSALDRWRPLIEDES